MTNAFAAALVLAAFAGPAAAQPEAAKAACPEYPELVQEWQKGRLSSLDLETAASSDRDAVQQPGYAACFWEAVDHHFGSYGEKQWRKVSDYDRCRSSSWRELADAARSGCSKWRDARAGLKLLRDKPKSETDAGLRKARQRRDALTDLFPKDGRVIGVLDQEIAEVRQAAEQRSSEAQAQKMQKATDTGSLSAAKSIQGMGGDAAKTGGALNAMYGERGGGAAGAVKAPMTAAAVGTQGLSGGVMRAQGQAISGMGTQNVLPPAVGAVPVIELKRRGYSDENIRDLQKGVTAASAGIDRMYDKHPSDVGAVYHSGTMTNLEDSAKFLFGKGELDRGCLSHQQTTLEAVRSQGASDTMDYKPVVIGWGMEHHAVVAYPKGTDWQKTGVVLDAWKNQDPAPDKMTYTIDDWKSSEWFLRFRGARTE